MQNNSLIRIFGILFGVVSIYQLSFTFITSQQEEKAAAYAAATIAETTDNYVDLRDKAEANYLDSIGNVSLYGFTTYNDAKKKELNKGLDLKGGINVILQISIRDVLKGLAENSKNPTFNQALNDADELQQNSDAPYVESFFTAFDAIKGDEKLASPEIFANRTLSEEITFDMSDDDAKAVLRKKVDESIVSAFEVLRKRIDKFGVTQPNIQRLGNSGRILVELPGARDVERVKNLLQSTAQLEFWETFKNDQLLNFLAQADALLKEELEAKEKADKNASETSEVDDLLADVASEDSIASNVANPIMSKIVGFGYQGGPVLAQFARKDQEQISAYLDRPDVRRLLPAAFRYIKFAWGNP